MTETIAINIQGTRIYPCSDVDLRTKFRWFMQWNCVVKDGEAEPRTKPKHHQISMMHEGDATTFVIVSGSYTRLGGAWVVLSANGYYVLGTRIGGGSFFFKEVAATVGNEVDNEALQQITAKLLAA